MIFLQITPLSKPVAITEMLILLAGAAFIGWLLARWIMAGRLSGLRDDLVERQRELDYCRNTRQKYLYEQEASISKSLFVQHDPVVSVPDDLKIIEGIGPKIEELLNASGILTFAKLAATDTNYLTALLKEAGSRFQIHNPGTWPEQAALARDGKWEELKELQDRLSGGRE